MAVPYELPVLEATLPPAPSGDPARDAGPASEEDPLELLEAARAEADAIRAAARAAGHAEGVELGRAEVLAQARSGVAALASAACALDAARDEVAERVETAAVELALRIAEKVVAGAIEVRPERVLEVVRGALRCLAERERVQVLVHPDDLAIVRAGIDELATELGGIEHVEILQERRAARGDAIVRTVEAEIDARLAVKLERARAAVEEELRP
ncbi:MAG: hypothetical protein LT070_07955 [Solirubrobacteraceae bacterium]|nr:hypothetical protein [Solirubrobacteraceae bacterium]